MPWIKKAKSGNSLYNDVLDFVLKTMEDQEMSYMDTQENEMSENQEEVVSSAIEDIKNAIAKLKKK